MVKEVLDKGKLKKSKRSGEGIYSEEAGNVLKAKTPEEEYIANREAEIKEVKDKIKENEKAIKEAKKKLPSREEERENNKKMVEEFSIKRLSEFLSDEELEIIKKGREYSELDEIIEEGKVDPLDGLIEKVFEGIKNLTDEEKLIVAEYLGTKQIILVDIHQYDCQGGSSCSVGFCYNDFEDEMYKYYEIKKNIGRLGLNKRHKSVGNSCWRIDDNFYANVRKQVSDEVMSEGYKGVKSEFEKLNKEKEKLEKMLENLKERKYAVKKYGFPEKEAISLYQWCEDLEGVKDEVYDKENQTYVVLNEYTIPYSAAGCEYGREINIKRGGNTTKKRFKYRDAYDYDYKNPRNEYTKIESIRVDGNKVEVTVSSGKYKDVYTFDIAYKEDKITLNSVEKKEFEESIRSMEERLIIENTKDQKYLASHNFALRKVPGAFGNKGMNLETELSYDKAKVVYENIIPEKGEAHVTILTQTDASGDMGRQFALIRYIVTSEGVTKVDDYHYWELNQIEGNVDKEKMKEFKDW